jgi:2-polyprenyl-6-methoxyphenol hydroxylase-like FAD-dependent oxidoreductase
MPKIETNNRQHAIVIGGSLGGLLTARVLSKHFDRVTIIEKDRVELRPESRPGQPQTRHLHALLATGLNVMSDYFPDLPQALVAHGAIVNDFTESMRWYSYGGYRAQFKIGFNITMMSRVLLEHLVRERVLALPQIELLDRTTVKQLVATPAGDARSDAPNQRISGAIVSRQHSAPATTALSADLIVDVTGRNSRSPQWLQELGYAPPPASEVTVNVGYGTRIYRRDPEDPRSQTWILSTPEAPHKKRFGGMFPIEGNRWLVSIGGWHGERAPLDNSGFLEFARSLPSADIYEIISQCEPLSEIVPHKFVSSRWRHYERLKRFPLGYIILGDAISSFNPTYGQGMSVAALEVAELDRLLSADRSDDRLAATFFDRVAKIIEMPWQLAIGEDFRFPQTTGTKPFGVEILNHYVKRLHQATLTDRVVGDAFFKVMNLMTPPSTLFHPQIVWRVWMARSPAF